MIIKRILVLSALFGISFNLQAASSAEDCSAITDDAKRLKCYDTFLKKQKAKQQQEQVQPETEEQTQPVEKEQPDPQVAPTEPKLTAEEKFGSEQLKNPPQKAKKETSELSSRAIGLYKMWEKGLEVKLDNGQVWEITDYRSAYHMVENPEVTIEKTLFGGYLLGIEGLNKRFRVERKK
jgi:hypothetical protein